MKPAQYGSGKAEGSTTCLEAVFGSQHPGLGRLRELAEETRALIESMDRPMEDLTRSVCPSCEDVCCISRHGRPAPDDLVYMRALDIRPLPADPAQPETAACPYLEPSGCRLPRSRRPYRCTWYFCSPLLEAMADLKAREARALDDQLARLSSARTRMMEVYAALETGLVTCPAAMRS